LNDHCTTMRSVFIVFTFISCPMFRLSGLACRCLPLWIIGMNGRTPKRIRRFEGPSIHGLGLMVEDEQQDKFCFREEA